MQMWKADRTYLMTYSSIRLKEQRKIMKTPENIADLRTENWTMDLPNKKKKKSNYSVVALDPVSAADLVPLHFSCSNYTWQYLIDDEAAGW